VIDTAQGDQARVRQCREQAVGGCCKVPAPQDDQHRDPDSGQLGCGRRGRTGAVVARDRVPVVSGAVGQSSDDLGRGVGRFLGGLQAREDGVVRVGGPGVADAQHCDPAEPVRRTGCSGQQGVAARRETDSVRDGAFPERGEDGLCGAHRARILGHAGAVPG
jgi:hypothetical protein